MVTLAVPGQFFFMQDGTASLRVPSLDTEPRIGEWVEVAGFVETARTLASLSGALVRNLGRRDMPDSAFVTADQIANPKWRIPWIRAAEEDYSGRLVRLRGRVLREASYAAPRARRESIETVVLPVTVVPSGTLWVREYDHEGERRGPSSKSDETSPYVGRKNRTGIVPDFHGVTISHVHFLTLEGLKSFLSRMAKNTGIWQSSFEA